MAIETHTGRLIFDDSQVTMEDGTVLAVSGSLTPCASAVGQLAKWGQTQPVTVTGDTGIVNNGPVLFVNHVQWADQTALEVPRFADTSAVPKAKKAAATSKSARSRSKK